MAANHKDCPVEKILKNFPEKKDKLKFIHHRNLVLVQYGKSLNTIPNEPKSLQDWIDGSSSDNYASKWKEENKFMNKFTTTALLQTTCVIHELHRHGIVCGNVCASQIYFTEDRKNLVHTTERNETNGEELDVSKISDIGNLGLLFNCVLSGKFENVERVSEKNLLCKEPKIAEDLINKMLNKEPVTAESILKHPFFWSSNKKISFLCDIADYIKAQKDGENVTNNEDDLEKETSQIIGGDWITTLKLRKEEMRRAKQKSDSSGNSPSDEVSTDVIIEFTKTHKYNKERVCDLLRFLRNRRAHYAENNNIVNRIFQNCTDGFWEFFSVRYSQLFWHTYTTMIDIMEKSSGYMLYLDSVAENKELPANGDVEENTEGDAH